MVYTGALLAKMRLVLENLEVDTERMRTNLDLLGGLLLSERVMLALGEHIGKQTAHEVVYEIAMASFERGETFRDALLADLRVAAHLDKNRIDNLLDPSGYVGLAETIVEDVLAKA